MGRRHGPGRLMLHTLKMVPVPSPALRRAFRTSLRRARSNSVIKMSRWFMECSPHVRLVHGSRHDSAMVRRKCRRLHGEDRARSPSQDGIRHAAESFHRETASAMGPHHDQIGPMAQCSSEDRIGRDTPATSTSAANPNEVMNAWSSASCLFQWSRFCVSCSITPRPQSKS